MRIALCTVFYIISYLIIAVEGCADTSIYCKRYKAAGHCRLMRFKCPKTCGYCVRGDDRQRERCTDSVPSCSVYMKRGFCTRELYKNYMKLNCRKSCRACQPEKPPIVEQCQDSTKNGKTCPAYRLRGFCSRSDGFMSRNCRKTCGWCTSTCVDLRGYESRCIRWKRNHYCKRHPHTMRRFCEKTCRFCTTPVDKQTHERRPKGGKKVTTAAPITRKLLPLANQECGKDKKASSIVIGGRIIGGETASENSWIWQVGIYQYEDFICGGSLISPEYVITAAHCVRWRDIDLVVRAGDHRRKKVEPMEQDSEVEKVMYHEDYDGRTIVNDIAILKLRSPYTFTEEVGAVCLPKSVDDAPPEDSTCYITGWGGTEDGGRSDVLKEAKMPIVPTDICAARNNQPQSASEITENMLCAGYQDGQIESGCKGDSGGPYVCRNRKGKWVLHGVVSWGSNNCDVNQRFTVFTKVRNYLDWIAKRTIP